MIFRLVPADLRDQCIMQIRENVAGIYRRLAALSSNWLIFYLFCTPAKLDKSCLYATLGMEPISWNPLSWAFPCPLLHNSSSFLAPLTSHHWTQAFPWIIPPGIGCRLGKNPFELSVHRYILHVSPACISFATPFPSQLGSIPRLWLTVDSSAKSVVQHIESYNTRRMGRKQLQSVRRNYYRLIMYDLVADCL